MAVQPVHQTHLAGPSGFATRNAPAWLFATGFAALTAGLLAAGSGRIVELLFPATALLVGAVLYLRHPTLYIGFTWWLWFLTPEVRRLVDYQIGWNPISPVMIAPYLVAGLTGLTLLRCLPQLLQRPAFFPFVLVLMGLNYGYMIGLVRAGLFPATYGLLTWIVPVVFGFHVAVRWQQYPLYRDALQRVFLWGMLAMGIYGIVQFYVVPPWDAYWMEAVSMTPFGLPEPFKIRVWSTMNSPGPLAFVMMAGLLFAFAAKGPLRVIAGVPAAVAFLLSLVRAAWLGWAIGAIFLGLHVRGWQRMKVLAAGVVLALLSTPLLLLEPVADTLTERFGSLQDLGEDQSYTERLTLYRDMVLVSLTNVVGQGIGSTNLATKLANDGDLGKFGIIDSGVLEIMFVLGWPGTILVGGGVCWLVSLAFARGSPASDLAPHAARAVVLAAVAMQLSANTLVGLEGMVLWTFLGLLLSARMFHRKPTALPRGAPPGIALLKSRKYT